MSKILMISPEKCLSCRTCEIICSFGKTNEFNPKHAAVNVLIYEEAAIAVPVMCMQCENPSCKKVCPVGAIEFNDAGAVVINKDKCIGCRMCISACPLGNIIYNGKERKMVKCDLCGGEPKCAALCPSGAIQYKEATSTNLNKKKIIAEKFKEVFGEAIE
ncbi:Anaerobic dimethyl sulfoxide reductase chain B [Pelotomaculum sp. FP]|uniref:4Fe-4S dicluster domain-containing protein n=1 Tax=Pelotomaculum sp. FP TaxID=261474 RepID=UPI0010666930|nr:4Fe-4S dicluster domain-containing protein [Pelotomaculum sp. FP]TEB16405.1 Anaerobic dimethyl sulfoxide reductase chain B [Pelotomaculum sp. FP]